MLPGILFCEGFRDGNEWYLVNLGWVNPKILNPMNVQYIKVLLLVLDQCAFFQWFVFLWSVLDILFLLLLTFIVTSERSERSFY